MRYALRAVSSLLMLAALAALSLVSVLAVATTLVVASKAGGVWEVGAGIVVLGLFAALGVVLLVRRGRQKRRSRVGVSIATDVQPLFWVEIYRVAERSGVRPPDQVLLSPDTDIAATGHRTWLGLRPGVRRLHLGLPLLAGLTERELRAVVAHEFCRRWGPPSLARVLRSGQVTIARVSNRLGEDSTVSRIVRWYCHAYVSASSPITGRYELALDRLCADFAGNTATAAALSDVATLSRGWAVFVEGYAAVAKAAGMRPDGVVEGFQSFLQDPRRREQLAESADEPASERAWAHEGQMSLADRLAAVVSLPPDDLHDRSGPALGLLRYPEQVILEVEESMFGGHESAVAPWEDIIPEAARTAACEDALELARLTRLGGLGPTLSVAALLELISYGLVDDVVRPILAGGVSPEVGRQTAGRLVTGFLATAAIESGTASYRFSWAVPRHLVDEQGTVDNLPWIVDRALAEENNISALELWLSSHRVAQELELGAEPGQGMTEGLPGGPAEGRNERPVDSPPLLSVSQPGTVSTQPPSAVAPGR
jgi:hypothetical protein